MYYPSLFAPVRPFDSPVDVPVVRTTGRENPLDLSTKTVRQPSDSSVEAEATDLLMLDHRKLANLAASHSLSAMGRQLAPGASPAAILDPTLYRLAYGPEALAVQAPFCYDRNTGVAVPTSLAGHQLMSSFLQQRERCLEQQQQAALLAARTNAQQAAVAAAFMDPASLPYSLRTAMSQREAAAALAATRGLYAPTMPTPMVLPAFSLYTEDKGAFTSLRNGNAADKAYLNGATTSGAVEAARFAEHLQRLREQHLQQSGKCNNACCAGLSGLPTTVPCACCMQSPSQAALCARSPIGCLKDPATAATGKVCNTACDYLQPGLTFLHRPTAANAVPSELRLPVPTFCTASFTSSTTDATSTTPAFQPITSWSSGLPSVSTPGKTAFSVPKKKDATKLANVSQKDPKLSNGFAEKEHKQLQEIPKREIEPSNVIVKKEPKREEKDVMYINETAPIPMYQRKEHDVKSMLTPKTTSCLVVPRTLTHQQSGVAHTAVTAITPMVSTKCEGGTIPKTKLPPVLEPYKPVDLVAHNGDHFSDTPATVPSPHGPPPLIAVANGTHHQHQSGSVTKDRYPFAITDSSILRHQALLHGAAMSTPVKSSINLSSVPSDIQKSPKFHKKLASQPKASGLPSYIKEEPSAKPTAVISIPKPVPHVATPHHLRGYVGPYRPFELQTHPSWIPPANPNVTVSTTVQSHKTLTSSATTTIATSTSCATSSAITPPTQKIVKSEPLPIINVKKEPDYDHNSNVLQSLLVRSGTANQPTSFVSAKMPPSVQHTAPTVIMSNPNAYPILDYHQYQHMAQGLNLSHNKHRSVESNSPAAACTAPINKQEPKVECGAGLDYGLNKNPSSRKRPCDTPAKAEDSVDIKRTAKMEYAVAPGFAFQYPPFSATELKNSPLCPYTFVPEPPGYYEKQMVASKDARTLKNVPTCPVPPDSLQPHLPNGMRTPYESLVPQSSPTSSELPLTIRVHLKNARRCDLARKRSKTLRRILCRIYQANLKRKALALSEGRPKDSIVASRRFFFKMGKRRRIRSGLDMALKRNKKKRGIVYKVLRRDLGSEECSGKIMDQPGSLPIPAELRKVMVNKALGETVLHRASRLGYPEVVAYCLETNGGNVNARDNAGYTPLHECCSRGHLDIARALLQYGGDVNASAAGGIRPLHDAVENDHVEVVRLLLSFGADPSIATYSGLTPIKLARSPLMAEFLQGFMADISGEMDNRPHLPWRFWGSGGCLDPEDNGYDIFDGVPSDGEGEVDGEGDDFLFEVSDSPHLPTFRLILPPTANAKAQCNYLRLSDVLRKTSMSKAHFLQSYQHIEVIGVPRYEFEASATCSQLLTGSKLDTLFAARPYSDGLDRGHTVDLVRLDNNIRKVLGIETISVR